MRCKYIVGRGAQLAAALAAWREIAPDLTLEPLEITQDGNYQFDLAQLDTLGPAQATVFVAWDDQFLNFRRQELMGILKAKGFSMPPLICPGAHIAADVKIGENCLIGRGAIIDTGVQVGYNTVVGNGCVIGPHAKLGNSVWLGSGVSLGNKARIGSNTTLAEGVAVGNGIEIGKLCAIEKPGKYTENIPSRTYHLAGFATAIEIIGT